MLSVALEIPSRSREPTANLNRLALPSVFRYFPPAAGDLIIDLILIVIVAVCIVLSILLRDPKMMRRH